MKVLVSVCVLLLGKGRRGYDCYKDARNMALGLTKAGVDVIVTKTLEMWSSF